MANPNEGTCRLLRRAQLMGKYGDIIAKAAREIELEKEREHERISQANRAAALAEQNLLNSNENERRTKTRKAIREQLRFNKAARRASRRAMNSMKKTVEIVDDRTSDFPLLMAVTSELTGSSSRTVFEDVTRLQLVQETEDDVRKFLQSIM